MKRTHEPLRVIINADDLGMSLEVNDTIFDLLGRGLITSATLIGNAPEFDDAVRRIHAFGRDCFGVHLNATAYAPLTRNPALRPVLNDQGHLSHHVLNNRIERATQRALYEEWSAQVQRIIDSGIEPSHLDSHHHVHTQPQLFWPLKQVQRRFGIRKVRLSMGIYPIRYPVPSPLLRAKKMLWTGALRHYYHTKTTDAFGGFDAFCETAIDKKPPYHCAELMTHPGSATHRAETDLLSGPWRQTLSYPMELIDYSMI